MPTQHPPPVHDTGPPISTQQRGRDRNSPFLWTLPLLLLLLSGCAATQELPPQAVNGVLDLRGWDFATGGPVRLDGEWAFYWQHLLPGRESASPAPPAPSGVLVLPGTWRGRAVDGQALPGTGYATLRLTLLLDPTTLRGQPLALAMPFAVNTAHRLYVDGELIGKAGEVGDAAQSSLPAYSPYVAPITATSDRVEIGIQIANFHHIQGGIFERILLGSYARVVETQQRKLGSDLFVIGAIFLMGLYHLGLFSLRRRERAPLFFGVFCLAIASAVLTVNQPSIFTHWISRDWTHLLRIRLLLPVPAILALTHFVRFLFPKAQTTWPLRLFVLAGLLLTSLIVTAPILTVTALIPVIALFIGLNGLYCLGITLAAVRRRQEGATIVLLGFIPLAGAIANDLLYFNGVIHTRQMIHVGLFLFIFAQAYLLSRRSANAFTRNEELTDELRRSESRYRSIFEDSRDVIFVASLDGAIEAVNPAISGLLGYTDQAAAGMNVQDFLADGSDYTGFLETLARHGSVADFPVQLRHRDGRELTCRLTATVRRDATGEPMAFQGIVHDVTAYRQAEAQRQRALALQQVNQSLELRLEERTADLSDANAALQEEIAQRRMHQQEKDRLLALAQQQSEHLAALSRWLAEMQQNPPRSVHDGPPGDVEQKLAVIRRNLGVLQSAALVEQDPGLLLQIADTIRLLGEMELYIEQIALAQESALTLTDPLADSPLLQLSSRERQVLKLMAEGKSNPEIADLLTVRLNTVHTYLKRIRAKLEIQDTPGLIDFARKYGLID